VLGMQVSIRRVEQILKHAKRLSELVLAVLAVGEFKGAVMRPANRCKGGCLQCCFLRSLPAHEVWRAIQLILSPSDNM
jgi:hypothetical protein